MPSQCNTSCRVPSASIRQVTSLVAVHRLEEGESPAPVECIAGDAIRRLRQHVTTAVDIETHEPP